MRIRDGSGQFVGKIDTDWPKRSGFDTREDYNAYMREWRQKNPESVRRFNLRKYGITLEQYDEMLISQGGTCAICGQEEKTVHSKTGNPNSLNVDHDHDTGRIRGLLCSPCNRALGLIGDSLERAKSLVEYLES